MTIKHKKYSNIPDSTDPELIRPSDWNDDHQIGISLTGNVAGGDQSITATSLTLHAGTNVSMSVVQVGEAVTITFTSSDHAGEFDPAGAAAGAISGHEAASDPHPQYDQLKISNSPPESPRAGWLWFDPSGTA